MRELPRTATNTKKKQPVRNRNYESGCHTQRHSTPSRAAGRPETWETGEKRTRTRRRNAPTALRHQFNAIPLPQHSRPAATARSCLNDRVPATGKPGHGGPTCRAQQPPTTPGTARSPHQVIETATAGKAPPTLRDNSYVRRSSPLTPPPTPDRTPYRPIESLAW